MSKKTIQKDKIREFQNLIDGSKDKMSEGNYLILCNKIKELFTTEEKKEQESLIYIKVRIMTPVVSHSPNNVPHIELKYRNEIINVTKLEFDRLLESLGKGLQVHFRSKKTYSSLIVTHRSEDCLNCSEYEESSPECEVSTQVSSDEYITYVYPIESWADKPSTEFRNSDLSWGQTVL